MTKRIDWVDYYGFINRKGEIVIPCENEEADDFFFRSMRFSDLIIVRKQGVLGGYSASGEVVIPFMYQGIGNFSNGLASVLREDKWGYINEEG